MSVAARIVFALVASVLTGLLLAVAAFPIVGGLGLTAKAGADEFLVLPAELETAPLAQRTRILAADGSQIAVLYRQNRVNVPLSAVPELTRQAVIATEDARFYDHNGVDLKGTARAAVENARAGGVSQGGSTLTQQYVKNALLQAAEGSKTQQDAARELSLERKMKEARYALAIERKLSKDEILERYLNIAYYGNGVYGMGTAATFYFGKPVQELTLAEGALLAGIVQSPGRFDPVKAMADPAVMEALLARRAIVLSRMTSVGYITEEQRAAAAAEVSTPEKPLFTIRPVESGCQSAAYSAPYFCDYIRRVLEDTPVGAVLGKTREQRQDALLAGGLTIRTTLDPTTQMAAQVAAEENVRPDDTFEGIDYGPAVVVDSVEPGTGAVKAMAVNRRYTERPLPGHTKVNLAIGGSSGFQAGSTFKAFVLADALRQGIPLGFSLYSPQTYESPVFDEYPGGPPYSPSNAGDSEEGTFDLRTGTHLSVNTYYVQLLERTGVEGPASLAEAMGVQQFADGRPSAPLNRGGSFVLGGNEVSPLAMAGAYATFAARGLYCPPRAVTQITDASGKELAIPPQACTQVLDQNVADTVTSVLRGVVEGGPAGSTGRRAAIGRPVAGKTGTTNGSKAAWFVGYTPQLATAVWLGDPGAPGRQVKELRRVVIDGQWYRQVYGGGIPAEIFSDAMQAALADVEEVGFARPERSSSEGRDVTVPDVAGLSIEVAEQVLVEAGLTVVDGGRVSGARVDEGSAAGTRPRAGREVEFGATVVLFESNGRG
jgi:membrane peptidoglycan carboxypeptidase